MAFTKTPSQSTYETKTIKLVKELNSRDTNTNKDQDYINVFPELVKNRVTKEDMFNLIKRAGSTEFIASTDSGGIRGLYYWKDQERLYLAILNKVYVYNAVSGALVATLSTIVGTTTGVVGFCEYQYDTGVAKVVVTDGTTMSTIDSANTVVASADGDMPVHIPQPVYMDGYLFVIKAGTGDIYNSNLNDPLAWTPGDFITAEIFADDSTAIAKLNNYIVVFGNKSIEYFWDAANEAGSPLQRNDTPVKLNAYLGGLAQLGNKIYFIGAMDDSQPDLFILEDFKIKATGSEAVRRHLASLTGTFSTALKGNIASIGGHDFYILDTGVLTYAMELETQLWGQWIYQAGTRFNASHVANIGTSAAYKSVFALDSSQAIYRFDPTLYQDNGTNFNAVVITEQEDFDTYNQKFMNRLVVWADKPTASSSITVAYTDDDYQNYSTWGTVDLYQEMPQLWRGGRFRRRAFKLTFTANSPMRLNQLEVDLNMGQH